MSKLYLNIRNFVLLALVVQGYSLQPVWAHPFHLSSMEMEWNPETGAFEVSLKVDPNDLEREVRSRSKQKVVLEKIQQYDLVFEYLESAFRIEMDGQKLLLKPVGFEVDVKAAWIYFEVPIKTDLASLKITNELLLTVPRQTNSFLLKHGKTRLSVNFSEKQKTQHLLWNAATRSFEFSQTGQRPEPNSVQ